MKLIVNDPNYWKGEWMGCLVKVDGKRVELVHYVDTTAGIVKSFDVLHDGSPATPTSQGKWDARDSEGRRIGEFYSPSDFPGREVECPPAGVLSETHRGVVELTLPRGVGLHYSQYGEDLKTIEILNARGITEGRVLDIGAWQPVDKSNSAQLIENGFGAVLVEPSPRSLRDLATFYQSNANVEVIGAPVTPHGGWVKLHLTDDALSAETIAEVWREQGGYYGSAWFPSVSVADLIARVGGDFQVCSIDTEGTSLEVFAELMKTGARPRVVILEHDQRLVELFPIYQEANYKEAWLNGTNVLLEWQG